VRLGLAVFALMWPGAVLAQDEPKDAQSAVELARSAFEFRDFQKVIDVLGPWVRPMRILEHELKVEARSLLGVSLHLLGKVGDAKAEFGDLLLLEPKHKLDPFVVPPEVIATFEAVRRELKPTLDEILRERGEDPDPEPPIPRVPVLHPALSILPLGIPQFVMDQVAWGATFAILQVVGLGANIAGWATARQVDPRPVHDGLVAMQYAGVAVAVFAYIGNIIHSLILLNGGAEVPPAP
jgi:hypothetical protein